MENSAYWLPVCHYWQHLNCAVCTIHDEDRWVIVWGIEGHQVYQKQRAPHFNRISEKRESCGMPHQKHRMELCQKHLIWNYIFATHNRYRWNLGARLQTRIEISEWGFEGKKFTKAAKIPTPIFKGETNYDNGLTLYWHNCHICYATWLYSGLACVCTFPLQNFKTLSSTFIFTNAQLCYHSPWQHSSSCCSVG